MNVCFITNELYPFRAGGIGRLMYNFAMQNRDHPTRKCNFYFLVPRSEISEDELNNSISFFSEHDLGIVVATQKWFTFLEITEASLFHSLSDNYGKDVFVKKSIEYFDGLLYLESKYGIKLDIIEFPDYGGWAFTTINAKKAGLAFQNTYITVRLHSTQGVIYNAEPFYHEKGAEQRCFFELERQCIEQADLIISHLSVITDYNQEIYRFDDQWRKKVIHEFPPIFLDEKEIIFSKEQTQVQNFIFSSRLQPFKRPDLFIKASVIFLDRNNNYAGKFYIVSYGWDEKYINWLQKLVPGKYKKKIEFLFKVKPEIRNELLKNSIIVIPSNYESLCLFAYESALRGNKLILNKQCLAFGKTSYWHEGQNCLQFDGNIQNLVETYEKALISDNPIIKPLPISLCYWHQDYLPKSATYQVSEEGKLAIVAYGFTSLAHVNEKLLELSSLIDRQQFEIHLLLVHDYKNALITNLSKNIFLHYHSWVDPNPSYIKELLKNIQADYLAFLPGCNVVKVEFYLLAKQALDRYNDLSIVTAHVRTFTQEEMNSPLWQEANRDDYGGRGYSKLSVGGAASLVGFDTHIVSTCSCLRSKEIDLNNIHEESVNFFLFVMLNNIIKKQIGVLVIPKVLIVELPIEQTFLRETGILASVY